MEMLGMQEWIGIYKGLRLPLLGLILVAMTVYVYWPSHKKKLEQAKYNMLDEE